MYIHQWKCLGVSMTWRLQCYSSKECRCAIKFISLLFPALPYVREGRSATSRLSLVSDRLCPIFSQHYVSSRSISDILFIKI